MKTGVRPCSRVLLSEITLAECRKTAAEDQMRWFAFNSLGSLRTTSQLQDWNSPPLNWAIATCRNVGVFLVTTEKVRKKCMASAFNEVMVPGNRVDSVT